MEPFDLLCDTSHLSELCAIDHQETVRTVESDCLELLPNLNAETADNSTMQPSNVYGIQSPSWDMNHLFSFELDTNGSSSPRSFQQQQCGSQEDRSIGWLWDDIVGNPSTSEQTIELDDIVLDSRPMSGDDYVNAWCSNPFDPPSPTMSVHCVSPCSLSDNNVSSTNSSSLKMPFLKATSSLKHNDANSPNRLAQSPLKPISNRFKYESRSISHKNPNLNNEDLSRGLPGQPLMLSGEERHMLRAMGMHIPSRLPLNRMEEKALRIVRRKIRNKLSAQASRLKRQEYVIDLEHRMRLSNSENRKLRDRIVNLETENKALFSHLHKLRSYVSAVLSRKDNKQHTLLPLFVKTSDERHQQTKTSKLTKFNSAQTATAAAGGTSLLIVTFMILAWTALVPIPSSFKLHKAVSLSSLVSRSNTGALVLPGRSRNLLEKSVPDPTAIDQSGSVNLSVISEENVAVISKVDVISSDEDIRSNQTPPMHTPSGESHDTNQLTTAAIVVGVVSKHR